MTTLTTLELTPNAIALLLAGTDRENIEKTIFHCGSCNLYYCWADLEYHQFDQECGSQDFATNAEDFLAELSPAAPTCFTFFWKDGSRNVLPGNTPADALSQAGNGVGAVAALDFYAPGDDHSWQWRDGSWTPA